MKRTPLKRRSSKENARLRRYEKARANVAERSGFRCEARTPKCVGTLHQVHHRKGRDGDLVDDETLLLGVCIFCHSYIHENPAISYQQGWLVKRNGENNE
jgi:hypothetical protein